MRYSEIFLKHTNTSQTDTYTLFFVPNDSRTEIIEIIGVNTCNLLIASNLNVEDAKYLLELNNKVPRSLNAQASFTLKDVRQISDFII